MPSKIMYRKEYMCPQRKSRRKMLQVKHNQVPNQLQVMHNQAPNQLQVMHNVTDQALKQFQCHRL